MKKFFKYLFSFLLVVPFVFALTACGPSDPGDDTKNPEFAEFSSQAIAIMSAVDMNAEDGDGLNLSSRKKDLRLMPKTEIAEVFNMVKNHIESGGAAPRQRLCRRWPGPCASAPAPMLPSQPGRR